MKIRSAIFYLLYADYWTDIFLKPLCERTKIDGGTRWRSWLRHYDTIRKIAGSHPDEIIGFFSLPNPSSRTMTLGSPQPLTEMSTKNLPGG
jgi:hypothetical protein